MLCCCERLLQECMQPCTYLLCCEFFNIRKVGENNNFLFCSFDEMKSTSPLLERFVYTFKSNPIRYADGSRVGEKLLLITL